MGIGHWIMANFWPVTIVSLIAMAGAHFAITRLLRNGSKPVRIETEEQDRPRS